MRIELKKYLDDLEKNIAPIDEFSLGQQIRDLLNAKEEEVGGEELAELIAFNFMADYNNENSGWGIYYGPQFVLKNHEGQFVEFPSIKHVSTETIDYWKVRSESENPILALRYADLALEFDKKLSGHFDAELAKKVIDRTLEVCEGRLDDALGVKTKLKRALALSKLIKDKDRIRKVIATVIDSENHFAEDDKPGIWGYAFRWLILDESIKSKLLPIQRDTLIFSLEQRLDRLSAEQSPDPWRVENAALPLAQYFASEGEEEKFIRIAALFEAAFRKNAHSNSDGLLIANYLERLLDFYNQYRAKFASAQAAFDRIFAELANPDAERQFEGKEISVEVPIDKKAIDRFIESLFESDKNAVAEKLSMAITKIAVNFIPKKNKVEKQMTDSAQKHPLQFLMTTKLMSEDGYALASIGSLDDDYDQNLLHHFSQNLHFESIFLRAALEELKKRYTKEQLYEAIVMSPVFIPKDEEHTMRLLDAFYSDDYLVVSALSIPLIEDGVRRLFKLNKLNYLKPSQTGGFDVRGLGSLFKQGLIKEIFGPLGENVQYYFSVVLTEQVGWNLKNNYSHGLNKWAFSEAKYADRLFHILLCLALIRPNLDSDLVA